MPKTHQKVMKITRFDLLRGPFINGDHASRRVPKIKQNVAKMHQKSSRNEHGKMWIPMLQLSKTHAVDRPLKMHKIAFIFVVPDITLLTPRMQKSLKIVEDHRWGHVMCRRSCPPRGGPIRSVLRVFIIEITSDFSLLCFGFDSAY